MFSFHKTWPIAACSDHLADTAIHVWMVSLEATDETVERLFPILSNDEQARANRFIYEGGRRRYTMGRSALRQIVAPLLDQPPEALRFEYSGLGKPELAADHASDIRFNVTHSHELALIAVTRRRAIGVDVEYRRRVEKYRELAERFFAPRECEALERIDDDEARLWAFFAGWTRKEALLKATGKGLSMPLHKVQVTMAADEPARFLNLAADIEPAGPWQLEELSPQAEYRAAICYEGDAAEITTATFSPVLR